MKNGKNINLIQRIRAESDLAVASASVLARDEFVKRMDKLSSERNLRILPTISHDGKWIIRDGGKMLNLSSNDYLGIASDKEKSAMFCKEKSYGSFVFGSGSSRLLTGNYRIYDEAEDFLAERYRAEAALIFSSGYHMNSGLLPAICSAGRTLILADRLVHASIIDGMRLSHADFMRYRHRDYNHIVALLKKHYRQYEQVLLVTESIFSMDGDIAPLASLVELKHEFKNLLLYVDEAHAVGIRGKGGLGIAEEQNCIDGIDFLCGTMGKAYASQGAFVICSGKAREFFVNHARTLIFTTALPPLQMEWSLYTMKLAADMSAERRRIAAISCKVRESMAKKGCASPSQSHIIPLITGESSKALEYAELFRKDGFYLLPLRPPTVPEGTSRIRLSINASICEDDIDKFLNSGSFNMYSSLNRL